MAEKRCSLGAKDPIGISLNSSVNQNPGRIKKIKMALVWFHVEFQTSVFFCNYRLNFLIKVLMGNVEPYNGLSLENISQILPLDS